MKTAQARALGRQVTEQVGKGHNQKAYNMLAPVLDKRTPFAMLRHIGDALGTLPLETVEGLLEIIANGKTVGGWVVIASALEGKLGNNLVAAMQRCRNYILQADVWYGADTLAEGVSGRGLVSYFAPTLAILTTWRSEESHWLRRACGASVHHWAKRSKGASELEPLAAKLLDFLAPLFVEQQISAVKGVGWGLKTLGRYYPTLVTEWLVDEVLPRVGNYRALMLKKTIKYLPREMQDEVMQVA